MHKDFRRLLRTLADKGVRVERRGPRAGHTYLVYCPDSSIVTFHAHDNGDPRVMRNIIGRLRRGGVDI